MSEDMCDWEKAVKENARVVVAVAQRILGNEHDAEDVAQDVFCESLQLIGDERVTDWPGMFRRLATLRAIDRRRRRRPNTDVNGLRSTGSDPSDLAIQRELAERLRQAISQLPEQQAAVFSLRYLEQLSRDEIAICLKISPEGVSSALHKARLTLQFPDYLPEDVVDPRQTIWISGDRTKFATQNRWGARWDNLVERITSRFDVKTGRLRISKTEVEDDAEMRFFSDLLDQLKASGNMGRRRGKLIDSGYQHVNLDGKDYTDFRFLFKYQDTTPSEEEMTVRVDRETKRPMQLTSQFQAEGYPPRVYLIEYPEVGPDDIYALDVPKDAPVDDVRSLARFFPAKQPRNPEDYEMIAMEFAVTGDREYLNWAYRYRKIDDVTIKELADPDKVMALARKAYVDGRGVPATEEELGWFTDQIRGFDFSLQEETAPNYPQSRCYPPLGSVDDYDSTGKSTLKGFEETFELRGPDRTVWLDPTRDMIVRRLECAIKDKAGVVHEFQEVVKGPNGNWFAARWAGGSVEKRGGELTSPRSQFVCEFEFK